MKTTGNLGLKKPDGTDIVDIADINGNMDILDTAVKGAQDHAADTVKHITAAERTAWNAKASTAAATGSAAGLMAAADKAKLDGVAAGANNYAHPATHPATMITEDATHRFATDTEKSTWNAKASTSAATSTVAGLMSSADKAKLDGVATGANNYTHPNHTGDVTSTSDGVTAISAGVIVNADINSAAAIDASKIGTGVVSNEEFGYLDGVTSGIQGQLNAKAAISDYVRQPGYAVTSGTGAAYTVTLSPAPASLTEGFGITIVPNVVNTANPTLNVNGLGASALKDQKGVAYAAGKLLAGKPYTFRKVGTDFLADSAGGSGTAVAGDIRAGKTAATDAGDVTGTLTGQTGGTVIPGPSTIIKPAGIYDTAITVAGVSVPAANVLAGTTIAGTVGTMPNKSGIQLPATSQYADGTGGLYLIPPQGYYDGTSKLTTWDVRFVAANIRSGVNVLGVVGTSKGANLADVTCKIIDTTNVGAGVSRIAYNGEADNMVVMIDSTFASYYLKGYSGSTYLYMVPLTASPANIARTTNNAFVYFDNSVAKYRLNGTSEPTLLWNAGLSAVRLIAPPPLAATIDGGVVTGGNASGLIDVFDTNGTRTRSITVAPGKVVYSIVADPNDASIVYVQTSDNYIRKINIFSGIFVWSLALPANTYPYTYDAVYRKGSVYFVGFDALYKVNAMTGELTQYISGIPRFESITFDDVGNLYLGNWSTLYYAGTDSSLSQGYTITYGSNYFSCIRNSASNYLYAHYSSNGLSRIKMYFGLE